jgi:Helicase associated domain
MKLGQKVTAIRSTGKYVNDERRRKVLDDMGFVWRLRAASSTRDKGVQRLSLDQIYDALVTYRKYVQKGDDQLDIPNNFVVPNCEPWPQNVRGLPLGKMVHAVQTKSFLSANPGAKEKLRALGLPLGGTVAANDARFQLVYIALKRYKEVYGELHVPQPFVVPEGAKEWPEPTWGLRLGARVNAIRSQGTFVNGNPERRQLLDDLGFVWVPSNTESGSRRGRRRKEEQEEMEAKELAGFAPERYDDSIQPDNSLESFFGDPFDFGDEDALDDGDAPQWGLEGASFDDVTKKAEENARAAEEYKPPKNLAETLAEVAEQAAAVGVIKKIG